MKSKKSYGEVINVGSSNEVSVISLANLVAKKLDNESQISLVSYADIYPHGGFEDMKRRVPSIEKINNLINRNPTISLDQIIEDVIQYQKTANK